MLNKNNSYLTQLLFYDKHAPQLFDVMYHIIYDSYMKRQAVHDVSLFKLKYQEKEEIRTHIGRHYYDG